jgi:hypothetical protein
VHAKLLSGPPYFLFGSLDELLIPIGPLFQLWTKKTPALKKPIVEGRREKFARPSNMVCQFTEIYWSLAEVMMKQYLIAL